MHASGVEMKARRKDGNHHDVVKHFKSLGCFVEDVTATNEFCDIHVSKWVNLPSGKLFCKWAWIEIKDGNKPLTKGEKKFKERCELNNQPYYICRSIEDVERINEEFES